MNNSLYSNDTLLIIDIQADNKAEILQCVQESFEYMPGWMLGSAAINAKVQYPTARFFVFNLSIHVFDWWRTNDSYADTMDEDDVVIKDLADISNLLEFVWVNTEKLRGKEDLAAAFQKFFDTPSWKDAPPKKKRKKASNPEFNPMNFIEPQMPPAKMMYSEWVNAGGKALPYEATTKIKLSKIKSSWTPDEKMTAWQVKSEKMHKEMAASVANEIDKEILSKLLMDYEKYAQKDQAKQTHMWYEEASHQSKPWSKGWSFHKPEYEGVMIKSPYPVKDDFGYPYKTMAPMDY